MSFNQLQPTKTDVLKMQPQEVTLSRAEILELIPANQHNRLVYFAAPNAALNVTAFEAAYLYKALKSIPQFSELQAVVLPGTFAAGPLPEEAVELRILIDELSGGDEETANAVAQIIPFFIHFMLPGRDLLNVALLYRAYESGWQQGLASTLLEFGFDGSNPVNVALSIPDVNEEFNASVNGVFDLALETANERKQLTGSGNNV